MIPNTYAEWLLVLDRFGAGDDATIEVMNQGTLEWTNVVAERWTRQVSSCLNGRLASLSTRLQTMLDRAKGDYFAISNALLVTRRSLTPLRAFVRLPVFPEDVRQYLVSEVERWASETQKSLEAHAVKNHDDQGRLLKTIRDHSLVARLSAAATSPPAPTPDDRANPPVRGRRVIL
jgi:hypothetical protein